MKRLKKIPVVLVCFFFFIPLLSYSQDKPVYNLIGKKFTSVISTYGKPAHRDKSNPEMECIFYKTKTNRMVFVGNKKGVYQAEMCRMMKSKKKARKFFDDLIKGGIKAGFEADTLSTDEIKLKRLGTIADISFFDNTFTKKYEINVKAKKTAY